MVEYMNATSIIDIKPQFQVYFAPFLPPTTAVPSPFLSLCHFVSADISTDRAGLHVHGGPLKNRAPNLLAYEFWLSYIITAVVS